MIAYFLVPMVLTSPFFQRSFARIHALALWPFIWPARDA